MANMVLGRYIPLNTFLHRLDARIKILAFIAFIVAVFLNYGSNFQNFIILGAIFVILLVFIIIGRVSFLSILKSLTAIWVMMIFLFIINCLLLRTGNVLFTIFGYEIYDEAIYRSIYIIARLFLMITVASIFTSTTKPMEITSSLEWLLLPIGFTKASRIAIHIFSMTFSLALRFIPTLADEANKIMQAQASRGVDFKHGKFKDRFKGIVSLIIPLFVSCFNRSDELANAMDARGYNPLGKRTKYNRRKWDYVDTICLICLMVFLGIMIFLAIEQYDFVSMIQRGING